MRNNIDHPAKDTKSKLHEFHEELARFDHTDPVAVLSRIEMAGDNLTVRVGVRYKRDDFAACVYGLCLWIGNALDTIASIIPAENKWHEKYAPLGDELVAYLENYNNTHPDKDAE